MVTNFNDFGIHKIQSGNLLFYTDSKMKMCRNFPTVLQTKPCMIPWKQNRDLSSIWKIILYFAWPKAESQSAHLAK